MNKKPPRRSIVASFGALSVTANSPPEGEPVPVPATGFGSPSPRVPAGVIGATQRTLSDIREERDRLQALVDSGTAGITELEPTKIDPSPFPDRLPDDSQEEFEAFKKSFAEEGQQIPIQVRPHPQDASRYQVIYGHRRVRAARELGLSVKAIVRSLSDGELVVAQGLENGSRQDLSWIERALFASRMEGAGIKARDIRGALSLDDAELAKMRSVWKTVPADVISAIGRAPKVGRPRWLELAAIVAKDNAAFDKVRETLSADKIRSLPSDARFQALLFALTPRSAAVTTKANLDLVTAAGERLGKATFSGREVRLVLASEQAGAFAEFMKTELPGLLERFVSGRE